MKILRLIFYLLVCFLLKEPVKADAPVGYTSIKHFSLAAGKVADGASLTNFPTLINVTVSDFKSTANGGNMQSNANDIVFYNPITGDTLPHDLDAYNATTGNLVVWVLLPSVTYSGTVDIYMYYGKAGASASSTTATWPTDYHGVWHLQSTPFKDASTVGNDANHSSSAVSGQIAKGGYFDGSLSYATVPYSSSLAVGSGAFTISAWINGAGSLLNLGSQTAVILSRGNGTNFNYELVLAGSKISFNYTNGSNVQKTVSTASGLIYNGVWYFVAAVYNPTDQTIKLYLNGDLVKTVTEANGIKSNQTDDLYLGKRNSLLSSLLYNGAIDEAHIVAKAEDPTWLKTEYLNGTDADFWVVNDDIGGALPIDLLYFTSSQEPNKDVKLAWGTATETNNAKFVIERSSDAQHFDLLAHVEGAGNTTVEQAYTYIDTMPLGGTAYYRLTQVDYDQTSTVVGLIAQNSPAKAQTSFLLAYPVPFNDHVTLQWTANDDGPVGMLLFDEAGRRILSLNDNGAKGANSYGINNLSALPAGNYILVLTKGNTQQSITVAKK